MNARRLVAPLVVVAAVGGGAVAGAVIGIPGLSGAQESTTTTPTTSPTGSDGAPKRERLHGRAGGPELEAAAEALGLSVEELVDKLSDGTTTIADVAEQEGVDLDDVTDAMVEADRERIEELVNNPWPKVGKHDGRGPRGHGPLFGPGRGGLGAFGADLEALLEALDVTLDELRSELREGKSLADIAEDHGVDLQAIIDDLVESANAKLDEAVEEGRLTQEKADELKTSIEEKITALVNGDLFKSWKGMRGVPEMLPDK
jgi:hypothetical protein